MLNKLELGCVVASQGTATIFNGQEERLNWFLARHQSGDWGSLPESAVEENERALRDGGKVKSAYIFDGFKVLVVTEADRSTTKVLLPEELQ